MTWVLLTLSLEADATDLADSALLRDCIQSQHYSSIVYNGHKELTATALADATDLEEATLLRDW